jgi:cell division cycle 14
VENGDWNWIIPGKFLAFSNPSNTNSDHYGFYNYTPDDYSPTFKKMGITGIVRLNNRTYDESRFVRQGINHYDLFFTDGSVPPPNIVAQFLELSEREQGALAVHCKAGLGRTGTLIGIYAMKHYNFNPTDFIGWNRICRPGSILGPQQQYMADLGLRNTQLT